MVSLTIDGKTVEVTEGTTVLRAAEKAGIHIPTLCDHPHLTPYGGCRLCVVEVQGFRVPMASCMLPVMPGMVVQTDTEKVRKARKFVLTLLFSERNHFCPFCQVSGGDCELQNAAYEQDMTHWPLQPNWTKYPVDSSHPYYVLDNNRCIVCRRCVRACGELAGNFTLGIAERGARSILVADYDVPAGQSSCIQCGSCVQVCPTGALIDRQSAYRGHDKQVTHVPSLCVGCSVGCSIDIQTCDNQIVRINGDWDGAVNHGVLCKTGRYQPLEEKRQRVTQPMVRKNGSLEPVSWDEALTFTADHLKPLKGKADDGVAAVASTRLPAEALALFQEIFADDFGSHMVTSVEEGVPTAVPTALAEELGHSFEGKIHSLENADCVMTIGANLAESHQVIGFMVKRILPKGVNLVVVDPYENGLDPYTNYTIKAQKGSDLDVLEGLAAAVVKLGLAKGPRPNFDFNKILESMPEKTGISTDQFLKVAFIIGSAENPVIIYGKGITAHGSMPVLKALVGFSKLVGAVKENEAGLLSIKGEANSLTATQYKLDQPFRLNGHKAAYVAMGDDYPAGRLTQRLEKAPFLVVQASYFTPLTDVAHVVFPVEMWAEQEGHYVNLEGKLQKTTKALEAPAEVRSNVAVLEALAEKLSIRPVKDWKKQLQVRVPSVAISE
jgi:formate dehydrogenase major subunit